ncbi:MAG TPA: SLC13 family permease [Dokdonella sp.]|uniref:SLC13 family permease n=1 Tax=Dokdonella sp. TaxID=2291710 RepID=UPI002D7F0239|nr:SLC13 family permease [Dokdonella sp.]HET9032149.1 SLC13 family permease [Dokdonella sp.]
MHGQQLAIIGILLATMGLFLWGRLRHDVVALASLLFCVVVGLIPQREAFSGFGHPAVITVACVLVLGAGLQASGAVNLLVRRLLPSSAGPTLSILSLIGLAAALSGFMNNVGALALLMPVALQIAARQGLPPGKLLMPLAFGSILGGMTTLIGTPPNLIVSDYRASTGQGAFSMFDFAPVGVAVAVVGVLFVGLIGWRMVPARKKATADRFDSGLYFSEVRIGEDSKAADRSIAEVDKLLDEADAQIVALVRGELRLSAPSRRRILRAGDILVIEVEPDSLAVALSGLGVKFEEDVPASGKAETNQASAKTEDAVEPARKDAEESTSADETKDVRPVEVLLREYVATVNSDFINRSASDIQLRSRFGINLLAISRQGNRSVRRLRSTAVEAGDVLLLQGSAEALSGFASQYGCLPLAPRDISVPRKGQALAAVLIMAATIATTSFGLLPAAVAFAIGALVFVLFELLPLRSIYTSIDWSVIVLLAAMLPVADVVGSSGTADLVAQFLINHASFGHAVVALVILLVVTMFLSDLMNNAATAAVMCPIALSTATQLGANPDAFLMAIAIGSSCAFLTPIGHQNNTLILGPGGFGFGDFWRLGLVVELIVVAVGVPMILWVWPI